MAESLPVSIKKPPPDDIGARIAACCGAALIASILAYGGYDTLYRRHKEREPQPVEPADPPKVPAFKGYADGEFRIRPDATVNRAEQLNPETFLQ